MIMGFCSCCGDYTVVHGNSDRGIFLCDTCCPCYNHCPPLGEYHAPGKYYTFSMTETWTQRNMNTLFISNRDKEVP